MKVASVVGGWAPVALLVRAARRLGAAVAAAGMFLVAVPVLWLPGALVGASLTLARRPAGAAPNWRVRSARVTEQRRDSARPFVAPTPGSRRRQVALGVVVAAATVGALTVSIRHRPATVVGKPVDVYGHPHEVDPAKAGVLAVQVPYSKIPAGRGLAYVDELQHELGAIHLPPNPVGGYKMLDQAGRYVNVVGGERVTLAPRPCTCRPVQVWLVGGSAVFGFGQRDDYTIASDLTRMASAEGLRVHVRNLGVPGYTLWQEYQALLSRLTSNPERPDLLIFYDGFNDLNYTFSDVLERGPSWSVPIADRAQPSGVNGLVALGRTGIAAAVRSNGGASVFGAREMQRYAALSALVTRQLAAQGVPSLWFLQPDATASALQYESVTSSTALGFTSGVRYVLGLFQAYMDGAMRAAPPMLYRLRDLFDSYRVPVFFDLVHTNEVGAERVAESIYRQMRVRLQELGPR